MGFLQGFFGGKKSIPQKNVSRDEAKGQVKNNNEKLWAFVKETVDWYNAQSCMCAFPRYRQIAGIDCIDYRKAFYTGETEAFIQHSAPYFDKMPTGQQHSNTALWTCKTCGSTYNWAWEDFSIHVSRTVLKINELKKADIGAAAQKPIPLFVGLSGHGYPDKSEITPVDFEFFSKYMRELK
jgi:hypothetical protein